MTDNLVVNPTDYSQYSVTAPANPRLPGGGGNTISGLYDVDPALFGRVSNYITDAGDYGEQSLHHWDGVDFNIAARAAAGRVNVQGGVNIGQSVNDNCAVRTRLPGARGRHIIHNGARSGDCQPRRIPIATSPLGS